DHRREYLQEPRCRRGTSETRTDPLERGGEAVAVETATRFSGKKFVSCQSDAGTPAPGGDQRPERVRGADGCGAGLFAGPDHARTFRSRGAVPAEYVACAFAASASGRSAWTMEMLHGRQARRTPSVTRFFAGTVASISTSSLISAANRSNRRFTTSADSLESSCASKWNASCGASKRERMNSVTTRRP